MRPQPPKKLPAGVDHGGSRAYGGYRCRCFRCLGWRRSYDQQRWGATHPPKPPNNRRPPEPVDLPAGVDHGTRSAYRVYECGCWRCQDWRRAYEKDLKERKGNKS